MPQEKQETCRKEAKTLKKKPKTIVVILYILSIVVAVAILLNSIVVVKDGFLQEASLGYLILLILGYLHENSSEKDSLKGELTDINRKLHTLESCRNYDRETIDLLEKENETLSNKLHEYENNTSRK